MSRRVLLLGIFAALIVHGDVAQAQRRIRTSSIRNRPVISPYVNLFQGNNAGINSYFNAVRPQQVMNQYIRQSEFEFAAQQQLIDQRSMMFQNQLQQAEQVQEGGLMLRPTTSAAGAIRRPAGTFMNTSTFFPRGGAASGSFGTGAGVRMQR